MKKKKKKKSELLESFFFPPVEIIAVPFAFVGQLHLSAVYSLGSPAGKPHLQLDR